MDRRADLVGGGKTTLGQLETRRRGISTVCEVVQVRTCLGLLGDRRRPRRDNDVLKFIARIMRLAFSMLPFLGLPIHTHHSQIQGRDPAMFQLGTRLNATSDARSPEVLLVAVVAVVAAVPRPQSANRRRPWRLRSSCRRVPKIVCLLLVWVPGRRRVKKEARLIFCDMTFLRPTRHFHNTTRHHSVRKASPAH